MSGAMERLLSFRLLDAALAIAALWAVLAGSRPAAALALGLAVATLVPVRDRMRALRAGPRPHAPRRRGGARAARAAPAVARRGAAARRAAAGSARASGRR